MTRLESYQNNTTKEIKEFDVEIDDNGLAPMYVWNDEGEWKAVSKFKLELVGSTEFFASAHENRVRFTKPPLDGGGMGYGIN